MQDSQNYNQLARSRAELSAEESLAALTNYSKYSRLILEDWTEEELQEEI